MAVEPNKIIFSMVRVSKFYDKRPVLKDISLGFYYGAKIGVLGLNGSGKSSLLRIIAGADKEINGEIVSSPGSASGSSSRSRSSTRQDRAPVRRGGGRRDRRPRQGIRGDQREVRRADVRTTR